MSVYAYVCRGCEHLVSAHLLTPEAPDVKSGPYRCSCGCEISQQDPTYPIDRGTYERRQHELRPNGGGA